MSAFSRAFRPFLLAALACAIVQVSAHGWVDGVIIDGKRYDGWRPFVDPYLDPIPQTIVRHVASDGPVLDTSDPSMACNVDGQQGAPLVADVKGGSSVTFNWNIWWSDHKGPVTTYMASCGGSCTTFDANNAEFFKIDEAGLIDGASEKWASDELLANNYSWTVTIPKTLDDGEYLIRHEILAMHNTAQPQFYPSCTQVRVNNGGSSTPSPSELIKATKIYAGVVFPDIWSNPSTYQIPGPGVAKLAGGSGSSAQTVPASPATTPKSPSSNGKPQTTTPANPATGPAKSPSLCRRRVVSRKEKAAQKKKRELDVKDHVRRHSRMFRSDASSWF